MFNLITDSSKALEIKLIAEIFSCVFIIMMLICDKIRSENLRKYDNNIIYLVVLINLFSDIMVILQRGTESVISSVIVHIGCILYYISLFVFVTKLTVYARIFSADKKPLKQDKGILVCFAAQILNVLLLIITQFTGLYYTIDENNNYSRSKMLIIAYLLCIINFVYIFSKIYKLRKTKSRLVANGITLVAASVFIGAVLSYLFVGFGFAQIAVTFAVMIIFVLSQKEETILIAKRERELAEMDRKIMISQVQPHFVSNVLNTILYLCDADTETAKDAVLDFSAYLRENFASVNKKSSTSFKDELKHIQKYLSLEKLRFEERLNVEWNIEDINFPMPLLSVQPIVENAVKHGVCKKEEGGTVQISAFEDENSYKIVIQDDGVGFNVNDKITDKLSGITIVRRRLEYECGGTLDIQSEIGEGTVCTITVPKEK